MPYNVSIEYENGGLHIEPSWHIHCKAGGLEYVNCTFKGEPLVFSFDQSGESLFLQEQEMGGTGGGTGFECPEHPKLSVTLKFAKPEAPVYVSYPEPPVAKTNTASNIKATGAKLNGSVNPKGRTTTYWFEYGTSESYGSKTEEKSAGSGTADVAVSKTLTGLTSGTTYYYRVVAKDEFGWITYSSNKTVVPGGPPTYRSSFGEEGSDHGEFNHPAGIAVDKSGNLWVIDQGHNRIEKWSPSGEFLLDIGEGGFAEGELWFPTSIAIDAKGNLWVANTGNSRVEKFTSTGEFLLAIGEEGEEVGQFLEPEGVAIDAGGNVWVADTHNERLQEFTSKGSFILTFHGAGSGKLCKPTGLAFRGTFLYVADRCQNRIVEFAMPGGPSFVREWGKEGSGDGQFVHPDALAIDSEANVWVVDNGNYRVQEFTESGEYITKFGSYGSGAGQFDFEAPSGIAVDSTGSVWISDSGNDRVQKWSR